MSTREAARHCGQLRLEVSGEPRAVSICTCLACQRRTGFDPIRDGPSSQDLVGR